MNLPVFHAGVRVERLAPGEEGMAWAEAIRTFDQATARVLKRDGGTAVYRATLLGREVVLKEWELRTLGDRLKAMFRASRGHRHWRGAERLERLGIRTARCFALATQYGEGAPRQWLAMEYLRGKTVLEHLADRDLAVRAQHALAAELGAMIARFEQGRWFNRDHKPSNLIVVSSDAGKPEIAIIDCVAIQRPSHDAAARMFASLVIEPMGVGHPPPRALMTRAIRGFREQLRLGFRGQLSGSEGARSRHLGTKITWWDVEEIIESHGDPTPRINPLDTSGDPSLHPAEQPRP